MGKSLKTKVINRLKGGGCIFEPLPAGATPHKRGVHYFRINEGIKYIAGAMDYEREGKKYKKRIVVRPSRFRSGLCELYTYHFAKHWSAASVANRELIKEAQRRAHALEKECTPESVEWRIRFFQHYFNVFRRGGKPEEGMKRYSRFYQYVFVAIYRELKEEAQKEEEIFQNSEVSLLPPPFLCFASFPRSVGGHHLRTCRFSSKIKAFFEPDSESVQLLSKSRFAVS